MRNGHKTPQPDWSTYAGVVLRESICITLTYIAFSCLLVCGCDIQNAHLQTPASEKHYTVCGPKFGLENNKKHAIIVCVFLYSKSAWSNYWC